MDPSNISNASPPILRLPTELHTLIMPNSDSDTLSRSSLVCSALRDVAPPLLFRSVYIITPPSANSLVLGRRSDMAASKAQLLASYTTSLSLFQYRYNSPKLTPLEEDTGRKHALAILDACNQGQLEGLSITLDQYRADKHLIEAFQKNVIISCRKRTYYAASCIWVALIVSLLHGMKSSLVLVDLHDVRCKGGSSSWGKEFVVPQLPLLRSLSLGDGQMGLINDQLFYAILESVAPNIRELTLRFLYSDVDLNVVPRRTSFPELAYFYAEDIYLHVYQYIVDEAPKLSEVKLQNILDLSGSLLSIVPTSVKILQARLYVADDPPHNLLEQLKRLPELVEISDITFVYGIQEEDVPDLQPVRAEIVAYFETRGNFSIFPVKGGLRYRRM